MNAELLKYQCDYRSALQKFCKSTNALPEQQTIKLLRRCGVRLGLSTEEILTAHTEALLKLLDAEKEGLSQNAFIVRTSRFYSMLGKESEKKPHGESCAPEKLKCMVATLMVRTRELDSTNKKLHHEIRQRKAGEKLQHAGEETTRKLLEKSRRMEEELRSLSRRLLLVQEEERKKISRELHDVIAQALAGINIRLAGLQVKSATASTDLHQKISDTRLLVEQIVDIVHRVARDLRPSALDDLGFIPAVRAHIGMLRSQSQLLVSLRISPDVEQLGMAEKIAFYRVIQESLFNVIQHAEATRATVSITHNSKGFRLSIRDNGRGFCAPFADCNSTENHLGLLGMRERIEMIGGIFSLESKPGKYTAIHALLPQPGISPSPNSL